MDTVFVLVSSYVNVDSGDNSLEILGVYRDFHKAQEELELQIKQVRKDFDYVDAEEDNYVRGDMSWTICEKGEYFSLHCDLFIQEVTIQ